MMTPFVDIQTKTIIPSALFEIAENNCTMPDIKQVIFNIKTEEPVRDEEGKKVKNADGEVVFKKLDNPILATTVTFVDNTKVTVKNSGNDKVEILKVMLDANGDVTDKPEEAVSEVLTASDFSKEIGVLYAIFKRLCGVPDANGTIADTGMGRIIRSIVTDGYDEPVAKAVKKMKDSAAKKALEEAKKLPITPKAKPASLAKTVSELNTSVTELSGILSSLKTALNK